MSIKKLSITFIAILVLAVLIFSFTDKPRDKGNQEVSGVYPPTVIWNNKIYLAQPYEASAIEANDMGKKLGEIEISLTEIEKPIENNSSNAFALGSIIYAKANSSTSDEIIIESNGKYFIAKRQIHLE